MVRRRIVLTIEVQEARPNWKEVYSKSAFPLFFEDDKVHFDKTEFHSSLDNIIGGIEVLLRENGIEVT